MIPKMNQEDEKPSQANLGRGSQKNDRSQDSPKMAQNGPEMVQDGPKMAQEGLKISPPAKGKHETGVIGISCASWGYALCCSVLL